MPDNQFTIRQHGCDELRRMSRWWEASAQRAGLDERTAMRVDLCLNEAVGNVLEHGYEADAEPWVRISISAESAGLRIQLEDHAPAFDPLAAAPQAMQEGLGRADICGRGIHLIRCYATALDYRRVGGSNRLSILIKPHTE